MCDLLPVRRTNISVLTEAEGTRTQAEAPDRRGRAGGEPGKRREASDWLVTVTLFGAPAEARKCVVNRDVVRFLQPEPGEA